MIKKRLKPLLLIALLLRLVFSFMTWHPDVNNHVDWGTRFWDYGAKNFYTANVWSYTWPNQPPGTIYIYAGLKKLYDFIHSIFWYINVNIPLFPSNIIFYLESNLYPALLKLPSILADFGIAFLIYKNISEKSKARLGAVLWLFNPVVWYDSSLWGQTDSIIAFFVFLSFFLLNRNKPVFSVLSFSMSVYIKASLLIFIPVYILFFIYKKYPIRIYLQSFLLSFFIIIILTLPFSKGNPVVWLYYLYQGKIFIQQLQVITANAFNIWATIASIHERPQTLLLGPFTYQLWGTALFIASYVIIIISFFKSKRKHLFWVLSMIAFSSFMFMTNMHERYLFPFFPFFTVIAVSERKLLKIYGLVSLISFLNLYNFWWYPKISILINLLSFGDRLMPRVLGFVMFVIYVFLIRLFLLRSKTPLNNYRD